MLEAAVLTEKLRRRLRRDKHARKFREEAAAAAGEGQIHRDSLPLKCLAVAVVTLVEIAGKYSEGDCSAEDEKTLVRVLEGYTLAYGSGEARTFTEAYPDWIARKFLETLDEAARL